MWEDFALLSFVMVQLLIVSSGRISFFFQLAILTYFHLGTIVCSVRCAIFSLLPSLDVFYFYASLFPTAWRLNFQAQGAKSESILSLTVLSRGRWCYLVAV